MRIKLNIKKQIRGHLHIFERRKERKEIGKEKSSSYPNHCTIVYTSNIVAKGNVSLSNNASCVVEDGGDASQARHFDVLIIFYVN